MGPAHRDGLPIETFPNLPSMQPVYVSTDTLMVVHSSHAKICVYFTKAQNTKFTWRLVGFQPPEMKSGILRGRGASIPEHQSRNSRPESWGCPAMPLQRPPPPASLGPPPPSSPPPAGCEQQQSAPVMCYDMASTVSRERVKNRGWANWSAKVDEGPGIPAGRHLLLHGIQLG